MQSNTPLFPLSVRKASTHFGGGENFDALRKNTLTPEILKNVYSYDTSFSGQDIKIAVVSAFDSTGLKENLEVFDKEFNLERANISSHYPFGKNSTYSREWETEANLDVQWAHAFAPKSEISVVFSPNTAIENLLMCAKYAAEELGCGIILMCFGVNEGSDNSQLSDIFSRQASVFVSSSGDIGGQVSFPSTSPCCISVGGTNLSASITGTRISESAWSDGGGGKSRIFQAPLYQSEFSDISAMSNGMRGTPDISMSANFNPGGAVYISQLGGWTNVGGTSFAAACFAGICACIKQKNKKIKTSKDMLSFLYEKAGTTGYSEPQYNFYDITLGRSGNNFAKTGWDFATGLGSPVIRQLLL